MSRVEADDPRLAPYLGMYGAEERDDDLCIVESRLAVESLLDSPYEPVSLLVADRLVDSLDELLGSFPGDVLIASQEIIDTTVGFHMHRGVAACARRGAPKEVDEVLGGAQRILITEGVSDPENLGALFRNAAAFGVDGVLLDPTTCDPLSRRVIRVSLGHALRVPFTRAPLAPVLPVLRKLCVSVLALTPSEGIDIRHLTIDGRFALLVGNEGYGLSQEALNADGIIRGTIPMTKGVDSLNVATAAAVALALLGRN